MRILDRHLYGELILVWLAVLLVLLLITFGTQASELLAEAVKGTVSPALVGKLLLLKVPPAQEVVLPLVVLLAALLTFGRWYQDQQMVVLFSCGIAPRWFQARVVLFTLPVALLTLINAGWVAPWSEQKSRDLMLEAQKNVAYAALLPGRFNPIGTGGVFYAADQDEDGRLHQIWLRYTQADQTLTISAPMGRLQWVDGRLALVLFNGWSVSGLDSGKVTVRRFERFEGFVPDLSVEVPPASLKTLSLEALRRRDDAPAQALLHQKLIAPVSVIVMALMGLALSSTRPREGRFARVFWGLLLYVVYVQLITTFADRVHHGDTRAVWGMWAVPALYLIWLLWPRRRA